MGAYPLFLAINSIVKRFYHVFKDFASIPAENFIGNILLNIARCLGYNGGEVEGVGCGGVKVRCW